MSAGTLRPWLRMHVRVCRLLLAGQQVWQVQGRRPCLCLQQVQAAAAWDGGAMGFGSDRERAYGAGMGAVLPQTAGYDDGAARSAMLS